VASCIIRDNGWDAYPIIDQKWLSNENPFGIPILTGAFCWKDVEEMWPAIEEFGISVFLVVQDYKPNTIHIGTQTTWVVDNDGNVKGCSRGKKNIWYDKCNKLPLEGNYGNYGCKTLVIHGSQRIVMLRPIKENCEISFTPDPKYSFAYQCQTKPIAIPSTITKVGLVPPPEDKAQQFKKKMQVYDPWTVINNYTPRNVVQRVVRYIKEERSEWIPVTCSTLTTVGLCAASVFCHPLMAGVFVPPLITGATKKINYYLNKKVATFNIVPLIFKGSAEHKAALEHFYTYHFIDPETHLPYGFYYVDDHQLIQVPQDDPLANWTNVTNFFKEYIDSRAFLDANIIRFMKEHMDSSIWMKRKDDCFQAFTEKKTSALEIVGAAAEYEINIKENDIITVSLHGHDDLRQYVVPHVDKRLLSAIASNRLLHGGLKPKLKTEEILKTMIDWYVANGGTKLRVGDNVEPIPDFSNMKGKKRDQYVRNYENYIAESVTIHTTFIKREALPQKKVDSSGARVISMADKKTNIKIMNFFRKLEEIVYSFKYPNVGLIPGTNKTAKHDNNDVQCDSIRRLASQFAWCLSADAKAFDSSIVGPLAEAEMAFYRWVGLDDNTVKQLLNTRIVGAISHGVLQRFSGDMYTAVGNVIIMSSILHKFENYGCKYYCNGDDTLVFFDKLDMSTQIVKEFAEYGVTIKGDLIGIGRDNNNGDPVYTIPYCQMYYQPYKYTNDPVRTMSRMTNLVGSNMYYLARTVCGKCQGQEYLKGLGYILLQDVTEVFKSLPTDYRTEYKNKTVEGCTMYEKETDRVIDYRDPIHGLFGKIIVTIYDNKAYFLGIEDHTKREKELIKFIEAILKDEYEKQNQLDPTVAQNLAKVNDYVSDFGWKSILPAIAEKMRDAIFDMYGYTKAPVILSPQDAITVDISMNVFEPEYIDKMEVDEQQQPPYSHTGENPPRPKSPPPFIPPSPSDDGYESDASYKPQSPKLTFFEPIPGEDEVVEVPQVSMETLKRRADMDIDPDPDGIVRDEVEDQRPLLDVDADTMVIDTGEYGRLQVVQIVRKPRR
jgi:hypothetical protein